MLNSYMAAAREFAGNGYEAPLFDYQNDRIDKIAFSPLKNILYGIAQRRAFRKYQKKHGASILHIHTSCRYLFVKDVLLGKMAKKRLGVHTLLTIHVGDIHTVYARVPKWLKRKTITWLNRYFDGVCFLSSQMIGQFVEAGLDPKAGRLLYNFHTFSETAGDDRSSKEKSGRLRLLYVASINRDKGILHLLEGLEQVREIDFHLDLCGQTTDPGVQEEFDAYVRRLGDRVALHGYVTGGKKRQLFDHADILILPSYHEGMPLVVLEALAGGCGIISTAVGALPEILTDENVIWVEAGWAKDITAAVEALGRDPARLKRMQASNLQLSGNFSLNSHIETLCGIYDEAVLNRTPASGSVGGAS